jgi:PAS domain S-box-containing protein
LALQFTPYALIEAISALGSILLAVVIWRRRPGPGVVPFIVLMAGVVVWTLFSAGELTVTTLPGKILFVGIAYLGITTVPAAWLAFVLKYTGREQWLTRRNLYLLAIEPVLVMAFVATSSAHPLFWDTRVLVTSGRYVLGEFSHGPAFWVHAGYSYILLVASTVLLINSLTRSPQLYRGQTTMLLIGSFTPWVANTVFIFNLSPLPNSVDLTPLSFAVTGAAFGWSLYRFRLMDIVPVARHMVMRGMADAVLVLDKDYRIVDANPSARRLLGRESSEVIGIAINEFLEQRQDLVDKFWGVEQAQAEIKIQVDEEDRDVQMRISPLRNRHGEITGRIVLLHDVTEHKEIQRELIAARERAEEANRLKSEFLTTMSHELRTPLHAINGYTQLMLAGIAGELNDVQRQNLERTRVNGRHLLGLINDMLDLSRIESGTMEVSKEPVVLAEWLEETLAEQREIAKEKGLRFETVLDPALPRSIDSDPDRLKQIVMNLVSNAIKFTEKGHVRVEVKRQEDERWALVVADSGIGIPERAQDFIFDTFRQVDGSFRRKHGGTGLGLAIVRRLVVMMDGTISLTSAEGKGSTFTVSLPLAAEKAAPDKPKEAEPSPQPEE